MTRTRRVIGQGWVPVPSNKTRKSRVKRGGGPSDAARKQTPTNSKEPSESLRNLGAQAIVARSKLERELADAKADFALKKAAIPQILKNGKTRAERKPELTKAIEEASAAVINVSKLERQLAALPGSTLAETPPPTPTELGELKPEEVDSEEVLITKIVSAIDFIGKVNGTLLQEELDLTIKQLQEALDKKEIASKPSAAPPALRPVSATSTLEEDAQREVDRLQSIVHALEVAHPDENDSFFSTSEWTVANVNLDAAKTALVLAKEKQKSADSEALRLRGEAMLPPGFAGPANLLPEANATHQSPLGSVTVPIVATPATAPAPDPAPVIDEPIILDNDSKFVFVTMWSRTEEDHLSNCPGKASLGKTVDFVNKWVENCKRLNCNYWAVDEDEKDHPDFILFALEKCGGRAVVFVDYDIEIVSKPLIFERKDVDFMATAYNIDPRFKTNLRGQAGGSRPTEICFDPYALQPTGDVYYFANTVGSRELLQSWSQSIALNLDKDEHDVLSMAFNAFKFGLPLSYIQLPSEYLSFIQNPSVILKHTDCLPTDTDVPDHYADLTEIECKRPLTKYYRSLEPDDGLSAYLGYAKKLYKFGELTDSGVKKTLVVDKAIKAVEDFIKKEGYTFNQDTKYRKRFEAISDFPDIEVHLPTKPATGLTYKLPDGTPGERVKLVGSTNEDTFKLAPPGRKYGGAGGGASFEFAFERKEASLFGNSTLDKIENLDIIATNTSDNDWEPVLDFTKPYYINLENEILQKLIATCTNEDDLTNILGNSHQVMALLRCKWNHTT